MKCGAQKVPFIFTSIGGCVFLLLFCVGPATAFSVEGNGEGIVNGFLSSGDRISDFRVQPVVHGGAPHPPRKEVLKETSGFCPQPRHTPQAPIAMQGLANPLEPTRKNLLAGEALFKIDAEPTACKVCHGLGGDGLGIIFERLQPKPRNFTCYYTMDDISDGQMYWVIKNGSPGTAMPSFGSMDDREIWQLILYIRQFAGKN